MLPRGVPSPGAAGTSTMSHCKTVSIWQRINKKNRGAWGAHPVKFSFGQVMISQLVGSSPTSGSVLTAGSLLPILCLPLSLPLPCSCSVSLFFKNKHETFFLRSDPEDVQDPCLLLTSYCVETVGVVCACLPWNIPLPSATAGPPCCQPSSSQLSTSVKTNRTSNSRSLTVLP